ncbi:MAG: choice-of-anchor D domain-containing protein, partial [Verrucomicrobiaceae bacterium]
MRLRCLLYPAGVLFAAFSAFANQAPEALTPAPVPPVLRSGGTVKELDLSPAFRDPDGNSAVRVGVRLGSTVKNVDLVLFDHTEPITVANFLSYVSSGRHNANFFHRSVPGFVVQGGGFRWSSSEGVEPVPTFAPIQNEPGRSNLRGTIAMAKLGGDPNSATSQWFVNLANNSANLDAQNGGFTVFGRVAGSGMTVIDEVAALPRYNAGGAFDTLPLKDFTGTNIQRVHTIETNSTIIPTLSFSAVSSDPSLVGASVVGSMLRLSPSASRSGATTVTVTATDLDGASTQSILTVNVIPRSLGWHVETGEGGELVRFNLDPSNGSALIQDPAPAHVGDVKETYSISRTFTVKNSGTATLTGLTLTNQGTSLGEFTVTTPLGTTALATGESTSFGVTFTPTAAGDRNAVLRLASADPDLASLDLLLTGIGIPVPPPTFTGVTPQSISAGITGFAEVPDFRDSQVTATDPEGVTSFVQSPAPGTVLRLGTYPLIFTATNSLGKVGAVQSTLTVRFPAVNEPKLTSAGTRIGEPVPVNGSEGLPSGSV